MNILSDWQVRYNFYCNPSIYMWQKRHVLNGLDLYLYLIYTLVREG